MGRQPHSIADGTCSNSHNFVVALYEEQPYLVDVTEPVDVKQVLPSIPKRVNAEIDAGTKEKQAKEDAKVSTTSVLYTATGEHIISATSKGRLNLIDAATCEVIYSQKVCSGVVTGVRLSRSGKEILVNAQDRIIRTFHVPNLAAAGLDPDTIRLPLEHKFQDVVNKLSWNHVTFSGTGGEYVAASTYNNHELYIWERQHGSLVRMLEGPKEEQGPLEWHPHRPMLAAGGLETGRIYMWGVANPQKWSALAPDDWIRRVPQLKLGHFGLGRRPSSPGFGAIALPTAGVGDHDGYLCPGSATLTAVAAVVLGRIPAVAP